MDEEKLKRDLKTLDSLRELIFGNIKGILNEDEEALAQLYDYKNLKAEVILELTSSYGLPVINDPILRDQLRNLLKDGDEFITRIKNNENADKELINYLQKLLKAEFDSERFDEVADDLFLTWFSHYDYVDRLMETATIIVKNIDLPKKLNSLIYELRQCVVFQRYLAAGIMLRTLTEVVILDIIKKNYPNFEADDLHHNLNFLSNKSKFAIPAASLNAYRRDLNDYVHGEKIMKRDRLYGFLDIVLSQIQELYDSSA